MKVSPSISYRPPTVNEAGSLDPEAHWNIAAAESCELTWWWIEPTYLEPSLLERQTKSLFNEESWMITGNVCEPARLPSLFYHKDVLWFSFKSNLLVLSSIKAWGNKIKQNKKLTWQSGRQSHHPCKSKRHCWRWVWMIQYRRRLGNLRAILCKQRQLIRWWMVRQSSSQHLR